ncbi:hypothetical protein Hgul01_04196 [Herpetosiphon gulosus]|uniref:Uncharacterized protein n=1 Tax=Herpetosiphon gulosus TaxID=1973496 RepID=A0ABP9X4N7_9CHLR
MDKSYLKLIIFLVSVIGIVLCVVSNNYQLIPDSGIIMIVYNIRVVTQITLDSLNKDDK